MKIMTVIIALFLAAIIVTIAITLEIEDQQKRLRRSKQVRRRRVPNPPRQQLLLPGTTLIQQEMEQRRQQQEQKRQEQKAARRVREALKRQEAERQRRAEAQAAADAARAAAEERAKAEQVLIQWKQERGASLSTPEQTGAAIDETHRARMHCGNFIHVLVLTDETGVALEWQVRPDTWFHPTVVGLRDGEEMFTANGYTGRHAARLAPGRYVLAFRLYNDATPMKGNYDVRFEIFVPDPNSSPNIPGFKKAIDRVAQRFVARAAAIDDGRRKVKQALTNRGADTDEVDYESAKFDAEISDLQSPD